MSTPAAQNRHARELLGARIAQRRKRLGMSNQEDLAAAAGLGIKTISNVESGTKVVRVQTMRKIELAIGWQPGSTEAILTGGQPTEFDPKPVPTQSAGPELRDEFERTIWGMQHLTEDEKWIHIDLHRARVQRRNESGRSQTG